MRMGDALLRQMSMPKPVCPTWRPPLPSARRGPDGGEAARRVAQAGRATKARLAFLAVTHRYNRTHCLWLEQFQIADYSCIGERGVAAGRPTHIRQLCAAVAAKNWRKRANQITGKAVPVRAGVAVRDCDMVIGIGGRGVAPPGGCSRQAELFLAGMRGYRAAPAT